MLRKRLLNEILAKIELLDVNLDELNGRVTTIEKGLKASKKTKTSKASKVTKVKG